MDPLCVRWEQCIVEMINSTWRCVRADARLLTQRLIIMKHMLSLHVPEPHRLERGLRWANPSGAFATRDECEGETGLEALDTSVEYAATVWGHVRTEMIKVATMRIKSQTRRICYLNLLTKGPAFLWTTKQAPLKKTWNVFTQADVSCSPPTGFTLLCVCNH